MSDESTPLAPPRGMRDFYPEDMALRNAVFGAWVEAARRFGFAQYDACVVETLDLLKRKAGEEIVNQIYAFADRKGRELALRPEMTPSLARMIAARQDALALPLKWFAIAQCFRYERMTKGRKREHFQWNLDIVGEPSMIAEAEVIGAAVHALGLLGLSPADFRVLYSSRALLSDLLAGMGIEPSFHAATFLALDKKGKIPDEEIRALLEAAGLDDGRIGRIFGILDIGSLDAAAQLLKAATPALDNMRRFEDILGAAGIRQAVKFDISVVRGLSYYTGIVFEAFDVNRQFRAIFGGGRYDNLLRDVGGKPATGVGLGFGDVVVAEILKDLDRLQRAADGSCTAVSYMEEGQQALAISVAAALRAGGRNVDLALRSEKPKAFFSRAGRGSFTEGIYIGPDDVARGTLRIKDLASRTEREVATADLLTPKRAS